MLNRFPVLAFAIAAMNLGFAQCRGESKTFLDASLRVEIRTRTLTAGVQGGLLRRLTHNLIGRVLVDAPLESLSFSQWFAGSEGRKWACRSHRDQSACASGSREESGTCRSSDSGGSVCVFATGNRSGAYGLDKAKLRAEHTDEG